jgi:hypothetical protein
LCSLNAFFSIFSPVMSQPTLRLSADKARAYTAAAGAFLAAGQLVYYNVSPDTQIIEFGFPVDFEQNGTVDVLLRHFITTNGSVGAMVSAFSSHYDNRIMATVGPNGYVYPDTLGAGDTVSVDRNWVAFNDAPGNAMSLFFKYPGGNNFGQWDDHQGFVGVEFVAQDGQRRYGWMHLDVGNDGSSIVIKGFGYESQPDSATIIPDSLPTGVFSPQALALREASLYPNPQPADAPLTLAYETDRGGELFVAIHDAMGREVCPERRYTLLPGRNEWVLPTESLGQGFFYVRLRQANSIAWKPFVRP